MISFLFKIFYIYNFFFLIYILNVIFLINENKLDVIKYIFNVIGVLSVIKVFIILGIIILILFNLDWVVIFKKGIYDNMFGFRIEIIYIIGIINKLFVVFKFIIYGIIMFLICIGIFEIILYKVKNIGIWSKFVNEFIIFFVFCL